jgi:hypothetical protein
LKSQFGRWSPSLQSWIYDSNTSPCIDAGDPNSDWTAELWPHGKRINIGAYGGTPEASMSDSNVGNIADLNNDDGVNFVDYALLVAQLYGGLARTIPRDEVVVDGNLNEWSNGVEWIKLDKVYSGDPCDIVEAWFALRWNPDTDKIYVAVIVEDTNHIFQDYFGAWDDSDRLELYSQGDAEGGDYGDNQEIAQQYFVAPDANDGSWATMRDGLPISGSDLEYAVKVNGDLIIYEVGVKQFDYFGGLSGGETIVTKLGVGHVVRFDVVVSTRWSDVGFGMLSENTMKRKWRKANHIALYILSDKVLAPPYIPLIGDLNRNGVVDWLDLQILCNDWLWQEQ